MGLQLIDYRPGPYTDHGPATLSDSAGASPYWITIAADGHFYVNGDRLRLVGDHFIETANGLDTNAEVDGITVHAAAPGINYCRHMGWNNKPRTSVRNGCFLYLPWRADTAVSTNEYCVASGNVYKRVSGSVTGTIIPSGTTATENDGLCIWAYQASLSPAPSTINDYYDEDTVGTTGTDGFLNQMDRTLADLHSRGIRTLLAFEHGDKPRMIENLAPNTSNGSADNRRAYADHGMMWSTTWNDCYKRHISYILNRTNKITGVAYKDNPMISIVSIFNENSFWNACTSLAFDAPYTTYCAIDFIVNAVGGSAAGNQGGSGWWRTALDTHWNAWAAANGIAWPQARFPTYDEWKLNSTGIWVVAGDTTNQKNMINYIKDVDSNAADDYETFIKAIMPNVVYIYTEDRYMDVRVGSHQDAGSLHCYESLGIAAGAGSPTRKTILDSTSGMSSVLATGGLYSPRLTDHPYIMTEGPGQYSRNRNDFDAEIIRAVFACLQDIDGLTQFCIWQNSFYSSASGNVSSGTAHYTAIWPSRRLAWLFSAAIFKWGLVGPITTESAMIVDSREIPDRIIADGWNIRQTGQNVAGTAAEWSFLVRQLSTTYPAATTNVSTDTSVVDANIVAGYPVTTSTGITTVRGAGYASPRLTLDHVGVIGIFVDIDNGTYGAGPRGTLGISGLSAPFRGMFGMRTNENTALALGDCLLVLHGPTFQTDMTVSGSAAYPGNFNAFMAGDLLVISGGTDANTRLVTPDACTITITQFAEYRVYGLTAVGLAASVTGTLIASVYSPGPGTCVFTSDPNYPAYYLELVPAAVSVAGTTIRGEAPKHKRFKIR